MATMAVNPIFLDTSLLIAASVEPHPSHEAAASFLDRLSAEGALVCMSPQVCREFLAVLTRQPVAGKPFTVGDALLALKQ